MCYLLLLNRSGRRCFGKTIFSGSAFYYPQEAVKLLTGLPDKFTSSISFSTAFCLKKYPKNMQDIHKAVDSFLHTKTPVIL